MILVLALTLFNIPLKSFFGENNLSLINEGSLAEQAVGQQLAALSPSDRKPALYYWHRESKSSNAEVDYLVELDGNIIPLEIKRGTRGRIRSLRIFMEEKSAGLGVILLSSPAGKEGSITYLPFYALQALLG